ncbi:MAG: hypothetical protein MK213_04540, partial [Planctomycetes bacterium]|nr:hypothetical protein [Planctomycetota bacterium]
AQWEQVLRGWDGPILVLAGDRGVAGCEGLLSLSRSVTVPAPWTLAGFNHALSQTASEPNNPSIPQPQAQRPSPTQTSEHPPEIQVNFLGGLVESLRDPLASMSGYMQQVRANTNEASAQLAAPALESARELDRLLDALHLAFHGKCRPVDLDWASLQEELFECIQQSGRKAKLSHPPEGHGWTDRRLLLSFLWTSHLYLEKFGTGGVPTLHPPTLESDTWLWQIDESTSQGTPPPQFLEPLLGRISTQLGGTLILTKNEQEAPLAIGLKLSLNLDKDSEKEQDDKPAKADTGKEQG